MSKIDLHDDTFEAKSNYSKEDIRSKNTTSDKLSKSITSGNAMTTS